MVENLTLSKMKVVPAGLSQEQISGLASLLEQGTADQSEPICLRADYEFEGRPLTQDSRLKIHHAGQFACTICSRSTKKLFDGYCYPCLQTSAQADRCLLNPVNCHFLKGTCREPAWGEEFCYQPHYVYLSFTDKYKVGITRRGQVPTRWFDQGATMAVLLAAVGSRHQAGVLEHCLGQVFADKSHWLKMLKAGNERPSLQEFNKTRLEALNLLSSSLHGEKAAQWKVENPKNSPDASRINLLESARIVEIEYPIWNDIPAKINSLNLDKTPNMTSTLLGLKGQYLFLEEGVFNVRRHEGYVVNYEIQNEHGPDCAK